MGDARQTVETVWRMESARIVAGLARMVQDVGLAEELAQDALVAALETWPESGVPPNPGGWLMTTARHKALDTLRRRRTYDRKLREAGRATPESTELDLAETVEDDLLRLIFATCHPALATEAKAALSLRLLGGLTTGEIARAFLTPEPTVAQRIVRAKRALRSVPFELPEPEDLPVRLAAVLGVIYLIFNEGYAATGGGDWTRPDLCFEALRLARILAALLPAEPEAHALQSLLELQASRLAARVGPGGTAVLLDDQDRARWDRLLIRRGLAALDRAEDLGGRFGPYALQAGVAACHARAATPADTDWERIGALYTVLAHVAPSPVVNLNRAVALANTEGPEAALTLLDTVNLPAYPHFHAVRGDLLARLGRTPESRAAFAQAATLTANAAERALFQSRATPPPP